MTRFLALSEKIPTRGLTSVMSGDPFDGTVGVVALAQRGSKGLADKDGGKFLKECYGYLLIRPCVPFRGLAASLKNWMSTSTSMVPHYSIELIASQAYYRISTISLRYETTYLYRRLLVTNRTSPCPCLMDDEIERRHRALRGCARRVLLAGYCIVAASL